MSSYDRFEEAVSEYVDSLKKKRSWKRLENDRNKAEARGWPPDKLEKYGQWLKHAFHLHHQQQEKAINMVKQIAKEISSSDLIRLEEWIGKSRASRDAWRHKIMTIDSSISMVSARIAHLVYMIRTENRVQIGDLIKKGR